MSDITDIETLVRQLIGDFSKTQIPGDIFTYTSSSIFTLTESNVISVSDILVNDVALSASEYSFDSATNKATISASLTSGDTIEIQYSYYPNYSSTEIENYIRGAVLHLSVNNYYTFEVDDNDNCYPELTDREKNIVSFITAILIEPDNKNYRLPDISISVPNSLSTNDMIRKSISVFKHNTHGVFTIS